MDNEYEQIKRGVTASNLWHSILITVIAIIVVLIASSCGKGVDGERTVTVVEETIVCDQPNVCSSERLTCRKADYYSQEWQCVMILDEK